MAETVAGGAYLNPDGETYHDANGKEVKGDVVAEAQKVQREQSERNMATLTPIPSQSNEALAAAMRSLLVPQPQAPQRSQASSVESVDLTGNTSDLAAETERRGRRQ